ncbi:MAG: hypothetical protein J5492_01410 [Oxalobacter sp.]|nr:hypothetical protein [Oxalobacter sp.]
MERGETKGKGTVPPTQVMRLPKRLGLHAGGAPMSSEWPTMAGSRLTTKTPGASLPRQPFALALVSYYN